MPHVHKVHEVDIKEYISVEDEENFFSLITLTKEDIILKEIHVLELGDKIDQEILRLILEETDSSNNLTMS